MSVANPITAPAGGLNQGCWKRKGSEEDDNNIASNVKKARYSWYVTLESESPQPTSSEEDDESIHSVQAQETEYVQDTSDTSTNTWFSDGDVVHVEYEVASLSEDDNPFIDGLSSSDPEDIIRVGMIAAAIYDSDVDLADDSDDSRSSRDSEISHADYWTCVQCNTSNNNPLFRYCEKCYRIRKNFFPPRPKGRKRRSKQSKNKTDQLQALEGHELTALDSGLGSSQCSSQPSHLLECKQTEMDNISNTVKNIGPQTSLSLSLSQESTDTVDTGVPDSQNSLLSSSQNSDVFLSQPSTSLMTPPASQEQLSMCNQNDENKIEKTSEKNELDNCSQKSVNSVTTTLSLDSRDSNQSDCGEDIKVIKKIRQSTKKSQLLIDPENKFCMTCTVGPKNAVFVHGQTGHVCCCYRCAKIAWKTTKRCPSCNRKAVNVLKLYYS